jgi:hypothetical protein
MNGSKNWLAYAGLACVTGFAIFQNYQINKLQIINQLTFEARHLTDDSFKELFMVTMGNIRDNQMENIKSTGKVEGMLAVISNQKPQDSETSALWHAGYYRGIDQSQDMAAISYETGYHAALDDISCPPNKRPNSETIKAKSPYAKDSLDSEQDNKIKPVSNNNSNESTKPKIAPIKTNPTNDGNGK